MMEKNKNLKSWREMFKLNHRTFEIFYKYYPQMILSRFASIVWTALTPYVSIYFSSLVIGELAGERNEKRLQVLVFLTLISAAFIALVSAFIEKWKETQNAGLWLKIEHIYSEKLFEMDYKDLDDTGTSELLSTIRQNQNSSGWGFSRVFQNCEDLCSSILTIFGGVFLTISCFQSRVPESAGVYTILNHPVSVIMLIVIMLLFCYIAPELSNKAGSYWVRYANFHNLANRLFGFFGWLGYKEEIATDVRI